MTLETFFEKFELFADAPDALPKMRGLVLELATHGHLVRQDPSEGDGASLLTEIRVANGEQKVDADESILDETPLARIPKNWAYATLGEVTNIIRGVTFPGSAKSTIRGGGDVACLRTASVQAEIDWDDLIYISPEHVSRDDQWVAVNDVVISMANSYDLVGKVAVVRKIPQKATFGGFLAAIRPIRIHPYFLLYVLRSPGMQAAFRASSSQTTNIANISLGRMRPLPFPLPPLSEQKRIVAKVDELMGLCDRLEAQQKEREAKHAVLARAALARFAEAPTPANLEYLFHPSFHIDPADLRKSILTMAECGRLVPQNSRDSASSGPTPAIDAPFDIPPTWSWVVLGDLVESMSNGIYKPAKFDSKTGTVCIRMYNIQDGRLDLTKLRRLDLSKPEIEQYCLISGDLLINRVNSRELVGKCAVVTEVVEPMVYEAMNIRVRLFRKHEVSQYINLVLLSDRVRNFFMDCSKQAIGQASVNQQQVASVPIPLPPLAEQRRIVAKVDALMALVDQLEAQLTESRSLAGRLMEAVVAELTNQALEQSA